MKRSEAIAHIVNVLRLTGNHFCDDGRDEQDAGRILKRLEVCGVLPPEATVEKIINCGDGQRVETITGNIWEDEEK
jgi:hypothetical protein